MTTAKIVEVRTKQPPVERMVEVRRMEAMLQAQPDKVEQYVDLRLTMEEARVLRFLAGAENGLAGKSSFGGIYQALYPLFPDVPRLRLAVAGISFSVHKR